MYIYAFLLSFNFFISMYAGNSLPFYLVLSCHGIRILCRMPLLLKVFHVQNDFLLIPSSFFFETVLFHHLDFIMTEIRNSFSVSIYLQKPKQSFDTQSHLIFSNRYFTYEKKNQIKTKTQILKYSTRRHLEGEVFFYQSIYSRQIRTYHHSIWNIVQIGDSNNIVNNLR